MKLNKLVFALILGFLIQISDSILSNNNLNSAPAKHIQFKAETNKKEFKKGDKFEIFVNAKIDKYWYTYSLKEQVSKEGIGPTTTEIAIKSSDLAKIDGKIKSSATHTKFDEGFEMKIDYYKEKASFVIPVVAIKDFNLDKNKLIVEFFLQLCDTARCLPAEPFEMTVTLGKIDTSAIASSVQVIQTQDTNKSTATNLNINNSKEEIDNQKSELTKTDSQKEIENIRNKGLFSFLLLAMAYGILGLSTPCVYPMVPITVSFFTKRAEKENHSPFLDSFIYAAGIVFTFTSIGVIVAFAYGATGIANFATNGWVNLIIGLIFFIFSLNLFGAFEIQVPTSILNKLNTKSHQTKGFTSVFLMGFTFSLISFTCTSAFVSSVLVEASKGGWFFPIIGMLGFSFMFATPFLLLSLFPTLLTKLPKSGGWMNNLKVVMGFIEIAAAIKYFSNSDLVWNWGFITREIFLSIWIACGILITLYILGSFTMKLDSEVKHVSAVRTLFAVLFSSITIYLLSGLYGKPLGELDAFLPPFDYGNSNAGLVSSNNNKSEKDKTEEVWLSDYQKALEESKKTKKPIFIDFTGWTCTNCRWMEYNAFTKPEIKGLMDKMILVRLYTDRRQEPELSNKKMQETQYGSVALPLYVIQKPGGKVVATKEFTRDLGDFKKFLQKAF